MTEKEQLFRLLASLPNVKVKSDIQLLTRCVICGDSKKDPNKMRMYIKIDTNNPAEGVLYHCHNCGAHGYLTSKLLEKIRSGYGENCSQILRDINRKASDANGTTRINRYRRLRKLPVTYHGIPTDENTLKKVKYVFSRVGKPINVINDQSLKIVWNLSEFLKENNFPVNTKMLWLFDRDYVGFLSVNNDYVLLRDVTGQSKYRWTKYNILDKHRDIVSYYAMATRLDIMSREQITIVVAEGVFDLLGIRYNVYDGKTENMIYLACTNGTFEDAILFYVNKGLVGDNIRVEIYIDNDSMYDFKPLKRKLGLFGITVIGYYNALRKDFGYPKDEIDRQELLF